jgi:hypothetical protein
MGLFPHIWRNNKNSDKSAEAAFGLLCRRYHGHLFPNGCRIVTSGTARGKRYQITKTP